MWRVADLETESAFERGPGIWGVATSATSSAAAASAGASADSQEATARIGPMAACMFRLDLLRWRTTTRRQTTRDRI